jgi:hypothetical protein
VRARRCLATLRADALADVDTLCLSLDHALQRVQPHLPSIRALQGNVLRGWPIAVAPLDLGNHFERDVSQRPRRALQPACFEPVTDDLVQLFTLRRTAASAVAGARQEAADVARFLVPARPGPQRSLADARSGVPASLGRVGLDHCFGALADVGRPSVHLADQRPDGFVAVSRDVAGTGGQSREVRFTRRNRRLPVRRRLSMAARHVEVQALLSDSLAQLDLGEGSYAAMLERDSDHIAVWSSAFDLEVTSIGVGLLDETETRAPAEGVALHRLRLTMLCSPMGPPLRSTNSVCCQTRRRMALVQTRRSRPSARAAYSASSPMVSRPPATSNARSIASARPSGTARAACGAAQEFHVRQGQCAAKRLAPNGLVLPVGKPRKGGANGRQQLVS